MIIELIIICCLVFGSMGVIILLQTNNSNSQVEVHSLWVEYCLSVQKQHEREKNNLIIALKSYTAEEFSSKIVQEGIETEEEQIQENNFQELDELALENPSEFDKAIGL